MRYMALLAVDSFSIRDDRIRSVSDYYRTLPRYADFAIHNSGGLACIRSDASLGPHKYIVCRSIVQRDIVSDILSKQCDENLVFTATAFRRVMNFFVLLRFVCFHA